MLKTQFDFELKGHPLPSLAFPGPCILCLHPSVRPSSAQASFLWLPAVTELHEELRPLHAAASENKAAASFPACPAHVSLDLIGCDLVRCPPLNQSLTGKGIALLGLEVAWLPRLHHWGVKEGSPGDDGRLLPGKEGGCRRGGRLGDLPRPHGVQGRQRERSL